MRDNSQIRLTPAEIPAGLRPLSSSTVVSSTLFDPHYVCITKHFLKRTSVGESKPSAQIEFSFLRLRKKISPAQIAPSTMRGTSQK